ncbi:MAG: efflux RND transporter periplasmic adaptor subunit [Acetobacteraceae bacterium]
MTRFFTVVWFLLLGTIAQAAETFTVQRSDVVDQKAVFATVESANVVPARARIPGTVAELSVRQGDEVKPGQVIAVVGDDKLLLHIAALDAQIGAVSSQLAQSQTDLARAETLFRQGSGTRVAMDQARTAMEVATATLKARSAERDVARQQLEEGQVLSPVGGRVLTVPVTTGTVVLNGDVIANIAEGNYILRLRIPERHAGLIKAGDPVRIDPSDLHPGGRTPTDAIFGRITLIYPKIEEGRVVADAAVPGLGDYFVGERIRVWIGAGTRQAIIIPAEYVITRFGLDYVRLRGKDGTATETPVQRGQPHRTPNMPDALEILSGLQPNDVLVKP